MKNILLYLSILLLGLSSFNLKAEETNTFIACDNSLELLEWDINFIRNASHSIEIAACYSGGEPFQKILQELERRLQACPNMQIHLLTTPILMEEENRKLLAKLEKIYADRFHVEHASSVLILWPDVSGVDNHVKMMIFDETYFSCGGTNLDHFCCDGISTPPNKNHPMGPSFPAGSRDQDVVGKGPLAEILRKEFFKIYGLWENYNQTQNLEKDPESFAQSNRYFALGQIEKPYVKDFETFPHLVSIKPSQVKMIVGGSHQKNNAITAEYIRLIDEAKDEILIGNLYFSPADSLFQALMRAVNRGVKVTVITNGVNDRSPEYTKFFCWANRICYVPIFYGKTFRLWESSACSKMPVKKVKIYEYYVEDVLLHKKVMLVDGKKFVIGSYNMGTKSDMADYEMILSFDSKELSDHAKKVFEKDLRHTLEITPKEGREWYFDPFISYMGEVQKKFHGMI